MHSSPCSYQRHEPRASVPLSRDMSSAPRMAALKSKQPELALIATTTPTRAVFAPDCSRGRTATPRAQAHTQTDTLWPKKYLRTAAGSLLAWCNAEAWFLQWHFRESDHQLTGSVGGWCSAPFLTFLAVRIDWEQNGHGTKTDRYIRQGMEDTPGASVARNWRPP